MPHTRDILRSGVLALACVVLGSGCVRTGTLRYRPDSRDISAEAVDLRFLHRTECGAPRVYQRTDLQTPRGSPARYVRNASRTRRAEGSLWDLDGSIAASMESERRVLAPFPWPAQSRSAGHAFLLEFEPPVAEWPAELAGGRPAVSELQVRVYDRHGKWFTDATGSRATWFGGRESVLVGGREYPGCVRLHGVTELRFGWWCSLELEETIWAHERFGIVRRDERLSGVAILVLGFSGAYRYDLLPGVEPINGRSRCATNTQDAPSISRLAIALDRGLPRPRIGGVLAEFESTAR